MPRKQKQEKTQDGGNIGALIYPAGKTLGYMTMGLMRINEIFQENYRRKHGEYELKPKLNKLNLTDKKRNKKNNK
jgi:hypothetical protein